MDRVKTGGKIIGEGEDGCVFAEPMWPCASSAAQSVPNSKNSEYVSKIIDSSDHEAEYIKAAARILGPELSSKYLIHFKGECAPATDQSPPARIDTKAFQESKDALAKWPNPDQACGTLKKALKKGDISRDHKVMYLEKYTMTLNDWGHMRHSKRNDIRQILKAIPPFLSILQKLYQNSSEQLINIDLHAGNIFVKENPFQFGIADFGHSLLRQHIVGSGVMFYGKYLCDYIAVYPLYSGYIQIPLEARLLNFCYRKQLDYVSPSEIIEKWLHDPDVLKHQKEIPDSTLANHSDIMATLLTRPLFIAMLESIQKLSRKLRQSPSNPKELTLSLSPNDKTVLEYIITRYGSISPINVITTICILSNINHTRTLVEFITTAIQAPYLQTGSSLPSALSSIQGADLGILWADTVESSF
jgi:hypothetical protein